MFQGRYSTALLSTAFSSHASLAALPSAQLLTPVSRSLSPLWVALPRQALGATHPPFQETPQLRAYCPMHSKAKVHTVPSQNQGLLGRSQMLFGQVLPTLLAAVFLLPSPQSICFITA